MRHGLNNTRLWLEIGVVLTALLIGPSIICAQDVGTGIATATVLATLSVTATHDLAFGNVLQGVQKSADKTAREEAKFQCIYNFRLIFGTTPAAARIGLFVLSALPTPILIRPQPEPRRLMEQALLLTKILMVYRIRKSEQPTMSCKYFWVERSIRQSINAPELIRRILF